MLSVARWSLTIWFCGLKFLCEPSPPEDVEYYELVNADKDTGLTQLSSLFKPEISCDNCHNTNQCGNTIFSVLSCWHWLEVALLYQTLLYGSQVHHNQNYTVYREVFKSLTQKNISSDSSPYKLDPFHDNEWLMSSWHLQARKASFDYPIKSCHHATNITISQSSGSSRSTSHWRCSMHWWTVGGQRQKRYLQCHPQMYHMQEVETKIGNSENVSFASIHSFCKSTIYPYTPWCFWTLEHGGASNKRKQKKTKDGLTYLAAWAQR